MKSNNVLDIIKGKNVVIPGILLKFYKELKLNEKELIFLGYLFSKNDSLIFDVVTFSKETYFSVEEIMSMMASLCDKKIITMVVKKDKQNLMQDYIDLSFLYNRLLGFIINEEKDEMDNSTIYNEIEKEFGRTLSPIEYETIKGWKDSNTSDGLIREALKEAVLNGVINLKYIDKILFEWTKKGYKKASDIKKKSQKQEIVDVFDYDWLKDNEE